MARKHNLFPRLRAADELGELAFRFGAGNTHGQNMDFLMVHHKDQAGA